MNETLGQFIRRMREACGMTQRQLSSKVGFRSLAHLSDIESGKRNPSQEILPKFAEALEVSVDELSSRDIRATLSAIRTLFEKKPEMIRVFLTIVQRAYETDAEEILARVITKNVEKSPVMPASQQSILKPSSVEKEASEIASSQKRIHEEHVKSDQQMLF